MSKVQSVPEAVAAGLQSLRNEQRQMANKLSELQMDLNEHKWDIFSSNTCIVFWSINIVFEI